MIHERDEFPHRPPEPLPARWQENFFIIASARDGSATFLVHCKRWPATGEQVARVAVSLGDRVVSARICEPIPADELRVGGLRVEVDEPFRSLRVRGTIRGRAGFGALGFIALAGGDTTAEVDLHLTSVLAPADFGEAFVQLARATASDVVGDRPVFEDHQVHYEQGGAWTGTVRVEDEAAHLDGLWVRDHTWGRRDESAMSETGHGFWTATALDGGNLFFNATGMVTAGAVKGVGVVVDRERQHTTTDVQVVFEPTPALLGFDRTRVRIGGGRPIDATGVVGLHLVKYLPGSGPRRFDDNGIARVTCGAMEGFGVHEYAGTLTHEQAAIVEQYERDHADVT